MQKSLAPKHGCELLAHPSEHLLNGGRVSHECGRHFQALWRDVTHAWFYVVGDPFHEVGWVFVLHVDHLFVYFFRAHSSSEHGRGCQVPAMAGVGGAHHVLRVPHLLGQLWDGQGDVLLGATGGQRGKSHHEEVKTRKWDQIHCQLPQVWVQLTWESQATCYSTHGCRDQMVQVTDCTQTNR